MYRYESVQYYPTPLLVPLATFRGAALRDSKLESIDTHAMGPGPRAGACVHTKTIR
jgi:hypothetical protein